MTSKLKKPINRGIAKVPIVMQMEALECGAACLCMILAYYNKWIPLEQVREDCGVSRDGSNAHNKSVSGGVTIDGINGTDPDYVKQEPGNVSIEDINEKMKELAQQVSTEQGDTQNTEEWPSEVGLNVDQTQMEFTKAEVKHF